MVGQNIGKYRVLERVGRGGMGTVYRAIDETLHREVAIKVLNAELNDPAVARRFRAEAVTVARLNHPGIATIYELFQNEGQWLMVMEFVRGETLENLVARKGALSVDEAAGLCMQVLGGLAHAHGLGVVHRDLKPANLMVTDAGTVKIMDFGIARVAGTEHLTSVGFMMGTPAYMAPEQVLGQDIDARADLYAIGVVFYHLTTGKLPFKGDTPFEMAQSRIHDQPTPVRSLRVELPSWVGQVMDLALAREPERRFQSAPVFREALRRGLANLPLETPVSRSIPPELVATAAPSSIPIASMQTPMATAISAAPTAPQIASSQALATSDAPTVAAGVPAPVRVMATRRPMTGLIVGLAAGVVLLALGGWGWMRFRARAAAPASQAAAAQAASAAPAPPSPPSALAPDAPPTTDTVASAAPSAGGPVVSPGPAPVSSAAVPARPTLAAPPTSATGSASAGRAGPPSTGPTSAAAGNGRAASGAARGTTAAGAAASTVAGGTSGRGRAATAVMTTDAHLAYGDLHALVVTGKKADEQQVSLHFSTGQISVISQKNGATLALVSYRDLVRATYVHAKSPKWDATLTAPAADVDMPGGLFRSSRHWLTLQAKATYVILRLNDDDYARVIDTLTKRTGLKVEQPSGG